MKAVVFDLYNTLIARESDPTRELFKRLDIDTPEARRIATTKNYMNTNEMVDAILPNHQYDLTLYDKSIERVVNESRLFPETKDLLFRLPDIKVGVLSNVTTPFKTAFYRLGLDLLVDEVVFSSDVGFRKPEPMIYAIMAQKLGVPFQDIIMTGDSLEADVFGPRGVGMRAVLLDRTGRSNEEHITSLYGILEYL